MRFIDLHCDTLLLSFKQHLEDIYDIPDAMLDVKRASQSGDLAQFFAIFMPPLERDEAFNDGEYLEHCFRVFNTTIARHPDVIVAAGSGKLEAGKVNAFLSFEDGRPIDGKLENLDRYYQKGIRLITLTWNGENCFGFPQSTDPELMTRGLKPFGKDAVRRMNELGIIVDVSHLSDGGFSDVAALSTKPFVASHSNCRALSPHRRNLTDDMIRVLAKAGGVAGLNFGPAFLNENVDCEDSTAALISIHAQRLIKVGGVECVALGSDFDGIGGKLEIGRVETMPNLFEQFHRDGLSDDVIEKIAWKNAQRVLNDVL
jgi:membrane dipeptidase